jgi:hypothetical protein
MSGMALLIITKDSVPALGLLHEAAFEHQPFDFVGAALDLFFIGSQADVFDDCAALERGRGTLDFEVFDQMHSISILQRITIAVFALAHGQVRY